MTTHRVADITKKVRIVRYKVAVIFSLIIIILWRKQAFIVSGTQTAVSNMNDNLATIYYVSCFIMADRK